MNVLAIRQRPRTPCFLYLPFCYTPPPVYQMASDSASVRAAILDYMQACFKHKVAVASGGTATEPTPCSSFTAELAAECRDIALSLADALNNIRVYPSSVQEIN